MNKKLTYEQKLIWTKNYWNSEKNHKENLIRSNFSDNLHKSP